MSPGEALDTVLVYIDAQEKINVRDAPAHVEEIGMEADARDLKATDQGWPFEPPKQLSRFDRQDITDSLIFVGILAMRGAVIGAYALALFSLLRGDWELAVLVAAIATVCATALALAWLKG
jgi:hypothetical protein